MASKDRSPAKGAAGTAEGARPGGRSKPKSKRARGSRSKGAARHTTTLEDFLSISVVVVARNEEKNIVACMKALAEQDYPAECFEVILVDDGSTDRTVPLALGQYATLRVVSNPGRSISANRNCGWRHAQHPYVAYTDADCVVPADWLRRLSGAMMRDDVAAIGGGNRPPLGETRFYDALSIALNTFVGSRNSVQGRIHESARDVDHLPTLNVLYRKDVLSGIGGFDERFARVGEDVDLSRRLADQGYRLRYVPDAVVIHRQRSDLASWGRNMVAYGRARTWLQRRHPSSRSIVFLLPLAALCAFPIYLMAIALYAVALGFGHRRADLIPTLLAIFVATHFGYAIGQLGGVFRHGDNADRIGPRRRVAMVVLKNAGNKGDEAIFLSVARRLLASGSLADPAVDHYVAALGPSGIDVRPLPADLDQLDRIARSLFAASDDSRRVGRNARTLIDHALRALAVFAGFRAVFICGGQWLHDLSLRNHLAIGAMFLVARLCNTRRGVFCIGAGPLRRSVSRWIVRAAFGRSALSVVRDQRSAQLLRDCGLSQTMAAADPALELPTRHTPAPSWKGAAPTVALSPCAWATFENLYDQRADLIAASRDRWQSIIAGLLDRGHGVALVPTMNPEDRQFCKSLQGAFAKKDITMIAAEDLGPSEIQGVIEQIGRLVSMRLHPIIFAANSNTPFIALAYADKVREFCLDAGRAEWCVDLTQDSWDRYVLDAFDRQTEALAEAGLKTSESGRNPAASLDDAYRRLFSWLDGPTTKHLRHALRQRNAR